MTIIGKRSSTSLQLVVVLCVLVGCVSAEKYTIMINQWVGQVEDALVATWGAPKSTYSTETAKYLTYENLKQNYIPPTPASVQVMRQGDAIFTRPIPGTPGYVYTTDCRTTFTIQNKRIVHANATGNSCYL